MNKTLPTRPASWLKIAEVVLRADRRSTAKARQASETAAMTDHHCAQALFPLLVMRAGAAGMWLVADGRARPDGHGLVLMSPAPLELWLARYMPCVPWVWATEFASVLSTAGHDVLVRTDASIRAQTEAQTGPDQMWESLKSSPAEGPRCTDAGHPSLDH
ncbi:hypothetical protein SAMN05421805_10620 [Saccharopolyspora antimicrobica]|uniref:Uncharacterized protein n=1 Tax=Saccharopolyspora antimicrobica TaxID=455193 RepID=A0A1I5AVJ1_9PSEU|nr:hypothetical protein [Saccharopolyspora antimicrobica]RKT86379.1 hypothetical protein ATL45_4745 [Saccharopolyspora antimicrobica]SFN66420.1 hypothetical protein SAMN05421805_10620 [Saccharopolyspora antimicrobica]